MENKKRFPSSNSIITGLMTAAFAVVMGLLYAYWYDLNDDVLMKDILSGVFTGKPEGHNIQMLYPISLLISLVYRLFRSADCYGIYLILCQYVSFFVLVRSFAGGFSDMIIHRLSERASGAVKAVIRIACNASVMLIFLSLIAGHFVIIQYTFTVAMMCSAAAVLYFEKKNVSATVFIILAFLTRSEMTLLMLPFVLLALFYGFADDGFLSKDNVKKYAALVGAVAAGLIICELLHFAGYSSKEWREFNSFFDSRTDVYDFYQIPDYEENREFYASIDLEKSEYELLCNYNFGIDDAIDADKMAKIAAYGKGKNTQTSVMSKAASSFRLYLYRLFKIGRPESFEYPQTDSPWNMVTVLMYLIALLMLILYESGRNKNVIGTALSSVWRLLLLFAGRTLIWLYIMTGGRDPIRITHSLYLIEITLLMLLSKEMLRRVLSRRTAERGDNGSKRTVTGILHVFAGICFAVLTMICLWYLPLNLGITGAEVEGRKAYNKAYEALDDYCKSNGDKFYFEDVYTSVAYEDTGYTYSQKMLEGRNEVSNMTLMGGWASKSPIEKEKLRYFGLDEKMGDAIFDEKAYVITDKDSNLDWMKAYYEDLGRSITAEKADEVADEFIIWKVR